MDPLDLITRLIIFLATYHSFLPCLFYHKKILHVNLVFRMALPVSSASWSTTRQQKVLRVRLRASIRVIQSSSTTHIMHWTKYSSRKQTRLTISNRKSFPFISPRSHSPSVWNNCILTKTLFCLFDCYSQESRSNTTEDHHWLEHASWNGRSGIFLCSSFPCETTGWYCHSPWFRHQCIANQTIEGSNRRAVETFYSLWKNKAVI